MFRQAETDQVASQLSLMDKRFSAVLFQASLLGCLLGVVATIYFLFGLAGYVGNIGLDLFVAASLALSVLFFLSAFVQTVFQTHWLGRILWLAILIIVGVEVLLCFVPPTARDELTHHLAIPRLYARVGRIIEVPMAPYSYYPMLLDMLYTPWVAWGYDSVPKLVHGLFGFLTGLSLYAFLSRRMNAVYGLLGFFFFISVPSVLRLSHWAYVDLGITFYATSSLLCLLRWQEERDSARWLVLAGLSAGFAVATKPNGLVAWLILSFMIALVEVKHLKTGLIKIVSNLALFAVCSALSCLPWLAKNWLQTDNPFFPFLAGYFPATGRVGEGAALSYVDLGVFAKRQLFYGESWWQIAGLPLRVFFFGRDDDPQYFDGILSPILILFLPWAFKGKWLQEKRLLASFTILFFAYALFLADLRIRYILLIVPPLVVLLVYGIFNVYLRIRQPVYLFAVLLFFAGLNASYLWKYWRDAEPLPYLFGSESREKYLGRKLAEFPAYEYINRELPVTSKIYLLFVGRRAYYCERSYFHDGGELPAFLLAAVRSANEPSEISRRLKEKTLTHLLIREELLARFLHDNLNPAQRRMWNRFASEHLKLLFRERGYSVLEIHG
jgi:hypothetical protein